MPSRHHVSCEPIRPQRQPPRQCLSGIEGFSSFCSAHVTSPAEAQKEKRRKQHQTASSAFSARWLFSASSAIQALRCSTLVLERRAWAGIHDLLRIDGILVHLLLQNLPIFSDEKVHAPRCLIFILVDSPLVRHLPAPIAQQGKRNSDLIREGFVGEGTIHAHTQDLGVGSFQRLQILLEVFHLLRSTPGESEDIKRQNNILLPPVLAQGNVLPIFPVEILQREVRGDVPHLGHCSLCRLLSLRRNRYSR